MEKYNDVFAWWAFRSRIGAEMENLPAELLRVAEAARHRAGVTIRKARLENWDEEVAIAHYLFDTTLQHLADHIPMVNFLAAGWELSATSTIASTR